MSTMTTRTRTTTRRPPLPDTMDDATSLSWYPMAHGQDLSVGDRVVVSARGRLRRYEPSGRDIERWPSEVLSTRGDRAAIADE